MILPFSTQINGKPSYFVEKIWQGFPNQEQYLDEWFQLESKIYEGYEFSPDASGMQPKLHTIREDKSDRWRAGVMIGFFINARKKNMFRFAPRIPVVSTQRILMSYAYGNIIEISINGREINDFKVKELIAINDGFDSWDDFVDYFIPIIEKSEDGFFTGKIIHWTDLKY